MNLILHLCEKFKLKTSLNLTPPKKIIIIINIQIGKQEDYDWEKPIINGKKPDCTQIAHCPETNY